jgi:predicted sugar kinase
VVLANKSKETFKKKEKEMKQAILQALEDRYNAQISEADATIKIYLENSVGIGEHPQHIDEVDKLIEKIANAQEKLKELQHYKL